MLFALGIEEARTHRVVCRAPWRRRGPSRCRTPCPTRRRTRSRRARRCARLRLRPAGTERLDTQRGNQWGQACSILLFPVLVVIQF